MNYLYFLINPETLKVNYIGLTKNIRIRLFGHISSANPKYREGQNAKGEWITSLKNKGLQPIVSVFGLYADRAAAEKQEKHLIIKHRKTLLNSNFNHEKYDQNRKAVC